MILESAHPYVENFDYTWTYTLPGSPATISITFDALTEVENSYDFIYIMDGNGVNIAGSPFTGVSLAGQTVVVPGDTVQVRLTSDSSVCYWGFGVTDAVEGGTFVSLFWTARTLPSTANWKSLSYGNGIFIALADGGDVAATSSDGINWTAQALPTDAVWLSVTFGNGIFAVVAYGDYKTATSPDGITWTVHTMPTWGVWDYLVYGNGIFIALMSSSPSTYVPTSSDCVTWALDGQMPANNYWHSVAYGNGVFVTMASNTTAATSPDAINWTLRTMPSSGKWWVTFGNGIFVAVLQGTAVAAISSDGINWTLETLPLSASWYGIVYGNGRFVAVATGTISVSSSDGIAWAAAVMPSSATWQAVAYGGGLFAAVAYNSGIAASAVWALPPPAVAPFTRSFPWVGKFRMCRVP